MPRRWAAKVLLMARNGAMQTGALASTQGLIQQITGAQISCSFDITADLAPTGADNPELEVLLLHLASDARTMLADGGTLAIRAWPLTASERPAHMPSAVCLGITLSGSGADRFVQAGPDAAGNQSGLALARAFAQPFGGSVRTAIVPGQSATLSIILPTARPGVDRLAPAPPTGAHGDATILLCDPDRAVRQSTATHLRSLGYTVLEVGDAAAAAAMAASAPGIDLLLIESQLPGEGSTAVTVHLRDRRPGLKVVFMTSAGPSVRMDGEHVLAKPFTNAALGMAVLHALRREVAQTPESRVAHRIQTDVLRVFFLHWQSAKFRARGLPPQQSLDPSRFGLAPYSFVATVDEDDGDRRFVYRRVGPALNRRFGGTLVGQAVGAVPDERDILGNAGAAYRRCVTTAAPLYQAARFDLGEGDPLRLERLLLPTSDTGETVSHIVGIIYFSHMETIGA